MTLQRGWWDNGGQNLVFFTIVDGDGNAVWHSSWVDSDHKDTLNTLRAEVKTACDRLGVAAELSSDDYQDWAKLCTL
jgi:hypothetical protein